MEVVKGKGYDAREMKKKVPCEMNRPSFVCDSNETERRLKDGHGLPGERESG